MNELALFAGLGGGILAGKLLGWRTICAVENDAYAASVLIARQNDGCLEPFPIWYDVSNFDGAPWRGRVDVVSGGFPCQDISIAGPGTGIDGERSGLWKHFARIVREVGPSYMFVENSPMLLSRGIGRVLGDMAEMGFNARWGVLGADDVGAPHSRKRIWILGYHPDRCNAPRRERSGGEGLLQPKWFSEKAGSNRSEWIRELGAGDSSKEAFSYPGALERLHGIPDWMGQFKALGNAQVPAVARAAWEILGRK